MSELNDKLLAACTDQFHGYELINDLLTAGAECSCTVRKQATENKR